MVPALLEGFWLVWGHLQNLGVCSEWVHLWNHYNVCPVARKHRIILMCPYWHLAPIANANNNFFLISELLWTLADFPMLESLSIPSLVTPFLYPIGRVHFIKSVFKVERNHEFPVLNNFTIFGNTQSQKFEHRVCYGFFSRRVPFMAPYMLNMFYNMFKFVPLA